MNDERQNALNDVATRNSMVAVKKAEKTEADLIERINHLEYLLVDHAQKIAQLEQKYALLLTARFDGRATS